MNALQLLMVRTHDMTVNVMKMMGGEQLTPAGESIVVPYAQLSEGAKDYVVKHYIKILLDDEAMRPKLEDLIAAAHNRIAKVSRDLGKTVIVETGEDLVQDYVNLSDRGKVAVAVTCLRGWLRNNDVGGITLPEVEGS